MQNQNLLDEVFQEIDDEAIRKFKADARGKINEIVSVQLSIQALNERLALLRKQLSELTATSIDRSIAFEK